MKMTERQYKILNLLQREKDYRPAQYFSKKLGISVRTLYTEISELDCLFSKNLQLIDRKRGKGIRLNPIYATSQNSFQISNSEVKIHPTDDRRISIMKLLLIDEKDLSLNQLAERYFVSKSSIIKDFKKINEILSIDGQLLIVSDIKGTRLKDIGEAQYIDILVKFSKYSIKYYSLINGIDFDEKLLALYQIFPTKIVDVSKDTLFSYLKNAEVISEVYVYNVMLVLIALLHRISKNRHLDIHETNKHFLEKNKYLNSASEILKIACKKVGIQCNELDIAYFSEQLVKNRFAKTEINYLTRDICLQLIEGVSEATHVEFTNKKFQSQLEEHIAAMFNRLKSSTQIENPYTSRIKLEFPALFNTIWIIISSLLDDLNLPINEHEVAFLTIYFETEIEKSNSGEKILVVCSMGLVTSELVVTRLKNSIVSIDSIEIVSKDKLNLLELSNYDLILSTVKLENCAYDYVLISPFLSDKDVELISTKLNKKRLHKSGGVFNDSIIDDFINPSMIRLQTSFSNKQQILNEMIDLLEDNNIVEKGYRESVFEREKSGSTDLPTGIAIPHGNIDFVNQTNIMVFVNKQPIRWGDFDVDVVVFLSLARRDIKKVKSILKSIYSLIENEEFLNVMRNSTEERQVLNKVRRLMMKHE